MDGDDSLDYKEVILRQIDDRNKVYHKFATLIYSHTQLNEANKALSDTNCQLKQDFERLKLENHDLLAKAHTKISSVEKNEQYAALEQKLFRVQEELTEVHRTKGARAQQILDLNVALQEKEKELSSFEQRLQAKDDENGKLSKEAEEFKQRSIDLEHAIQNLKDNYQALQMLSDSFEQKLRTSQCENLDLVDKIKKLKDAQVAAMNAENEAFSNKKAIDTPDPAASTVSTLGKPSSPPKQASSPPATTESSVAEAFKRFTDIFSRKTRTSFDEDKDCSTVSGSIGYGFVADVRLPQEVVCKWKAHENEVSAVRFSMSGGILATGGSDRLIHIWNFFGDKSRLQHTLRGSNGGITNIDFEPNEELLAACSNDYATRLWALGTQRLKLTLTGHGGKVLAARFLGSSAKLASGSNDRTVKVWDARSGACTRTFMAGSSCNDIVSVDASDCLASGHFDRKIRIWDARTNNHSAINEISVGGRVTSLDMPADRTAVICCTKDHTLELVDLRKSSVLKVFSDDSFRVATDQTRCSFSPDGLYAAVGSIDGTVLAWNIKTGNLESSAKHHNDPVISCSWSGGRLVTGDKHKTCVLWTGT